MSLYFLSGSKPTVPEVLKWMKDLNDWFSVGEKVGTIKNILDIPLYCMFPWCIDSMCKQPFSD